MRKFSQFCVFFYLLYFKCLKPRLWLCFSDNFRIEHYKNVKETKIFEKLFTSQIGNQNAPFSQRSQILAWKIGQSLIC